MIDKKLLTLLGNNKKYIALIAILNTIGMVANISVTALFCFVLNLVSNKNENLTIYAIGVIIIILALAIKVVVIKLQTSCKLKLGAVVKNDLRKDVYKKITDIDTSLQNGETTAGVTQIAVDGIEQLDLYFTTYLPQLFYAIISPILLFCLCVTVDYRTALVLLLCVPVIPVAIIAVSKYAKKTFNKYWAQYITVGDTFLDNLQGMEELKIFNADEKAQIVMDKRSEEFRKTTMKVLIMQLMSITIMDIVAFGGAALGIVMALTTGVNGVIAPILVLFLILISAEFFLPMRSLGSAFHIAMNGASAGKRIMKLLETKVSPWGKAECFGGDIVLHNVDFSYNEQRKLLNNINMVLKRKTFSAIVGESGCGKSTIISLIIGKIAPTKGEVLIANNKIKNYTRQSFYSKIALVSYNTFIFGMSIRDNFYLAKNNASDEDICNALTRVNLQHFLLKNGGLDSLISESANNISGGERQRLALAINLLSDKEIYIFDEATSNIDIESESIIMENINYLAKYKTVILISHRLANVSIADNIFVLKDGVIAEVGNHQKLIQNGGEYSRLIDAQFKLENAYKEA